MALLMDGELNRLEDLKRYDSSVLEVAAVEGIDLTAKLELAREKLLSEVRAVLGRSGTGYRAEQAAVTPELSRMHAYLSLELVYRDAYFSQLNDRYGGRWREFGREARSAWEQVRSNGIGLVANPMKRAQPPTATVGDGSLEAATYYFQATWIRSDGAECEPSELTTISGLTGHSLTVQPAAPPEGATGWNLYAGYAPASIQKQNSAPMPPGQSWTVSISGLQAGESAGRGQAPETYFRPERTSLRG